MTANKMPELPEPATKAHSFLDAGYLVDVPDNWTREQVEADRRACYLAGIAAARVVVQQSSTAMGDLTSRAILLANLSALEQEAKK